MRVYVLFLWQFLCLVWTCFFFSNYGESMCMWCLRAGYMPNHCTVYVLVFQLKPYNYHRFQVIDQIIYVIFLVLRLTWSRMVAFAGFSCCCCAASFTDGKPVG
jgi:hypothetical protein